MQLDVMLALQQLQRAARYLAEQWRELTSAWLAACPVRKAWAGARWSTMPSARTSSAKCWVAARSRRAMALAIRSHHRSTLPICPSVSTNRSCQSARAGAGYPVLARTGQHHPPQHAKRSIRSQPGHPPGAGSGPAKAVALYQAVYGPSDAMQHQVLRGVISSLFRMDDIVQCHPAAWCATILKSA
jgi:hypothetical protein